MPHLLALPPQPFLTLPTSPCQHSAGIKEGSSSCGRTQEQCHTAGMQPAPFPIPTTTLGVWKPSLQDWGAVALWLAPGSPGNPSCCIPSAEWQH